MGGGRAAAVLAAAAAAAGCKATPAEPAGVGRWDLRTTTLADASGHCEPTDLPDGRKGTWCFMQPPLEIGGQGAAVDLYFGGTQPTAPLIELQLKVHACDQEKADAWVRSSFGKPYAWGHGRAFWKNRYLYLALMPASASRCLIRFFPLSEQKEFERVKAEPGP
jgi:hypothetical protein